MIYVIAVLCVVNCIVLLGVGRLLLRLIDAYETMAAAHQKLSERVRGLVDVDTGR